MKVKTEMKYLGIAISDNVIRREDVNIWKPIIDKRKSIIRWPARGLTIFGRIILSKAEGMSKLIYPFHSLYISSNNIKKENPLIFQVLQKNKTHYIKKSQWVKKFKNGGFKALDFESVVGTFKIIVWKLV